MTIRTTPIAASGSSTVGMWTSRGCAGIPKTECIFRPASTNSLECVRVVSPDATRVQSCARRREYNPQGMESEEFAFSYNQFMSVLMLPFFAGPRHSSISVNDDVVMVRMGVAGWTFAADLPRLSITEVSCVDGPVMAWGAHGWRGRWLVNGSSRGLVRLTIADGARGRVLGFPIRVRELTLSLADPDAFVRAVSPI